MSSQIRLQNAMERIRSARGVSNRFLAGLSDDEWFWCPQQLTTHIAWQAGHLAVAQYKLCLRLMRGRTTADESLISDRFIEAFQLGSQPSADRREHVPLAEIRRVFEAVYEQTLSELSTRTDAELEVPVEQPHPAFKTRMDAVEYAAPHELVHAGQIALLRRLMGKPPLR